MDTLDCPPGNPGLIDTAISVADKVIVPVQPSAIEAERMWDTVDVAGKDKAIVLLTSVLLSATSTSALATAITDDGINAFKGSIPRREAIRVDLKAPHKKVNYALAEKHTAMAGIKGYETSRTDLTAEQVIGAYRQLFRIEKSFRMAKSDLKARPVYARLEDSIQAHLTIVMCAMAVGHLLEQTSGLSLKRLVRTLKKYRSFTINVAGQTIHAQTPIPANIQEIINKLPKMSY
uniref:IS1634 family transposase n=1 Tax=Corynebacterium cystitidis TaxID=35757 RepID=UPI00211DFA9E|nr:transposase [Corynebacterium cystitidis]